MANHSSRGGQRGGQRRRRGRRQYTRRRKSCFFCEQRSVQIDYKDADLLRRFVTDRGKIRPRRQTGACARHQRQVTMAIKRARHLALLPFVVETRRPR